MQVLKESIKLQPLIWLVSAANMPTELNFFITLKLRLDDC